MRVRLPPGLAVLVLAGCGGSEPRPGWIDLAEGFRPSACSPAEETVLRRGEGREVRLVAEGDHAWLEVDLAREDWTYVPVQSSWRVDVGVRGVGAPPDGSSAQRLVAGERSFTPYPLASLRRKLAPDPGTFLCRQGRLVLHLPEDEEPPAQATLSLFCGRGAERDGRWWVRGHRFSGSGLSVWSGERFEREVTLPPGSVLRYAAVAEPLDLEASGESRFVVRIDGVPVDEVRLAEVEEPRESWREVLLPRGGGKVRLSLEVSGAAARSAFLAPSVGPSEAASAPTDRAPDLVLFVMDTFRADSLAAYGGELGLTPNLDALAEQSLVFERAWATGTHTLPSHASLLAGVYPPRAGVRGTQRALPASLPTLAEVLGRRGYRTCAVTDSVIVSQAFGFERGFEWFDEGLRGIDATLERVRAVLAVRDPRPLFLLVHTYRAHSPYEVTPETRAAWGERIPFAEDFDTVARALRPFERGVDGRSLDDPVARALIEDLHRLYQGAVADLDRKVPELLELLAAHGVPERGWLIVTSDHGEAFLEHTALFHGGNVWEELLRVPLLVRGPGLAPGRVTRPVNLNDLPATLAWLGGSPAPAGWDGVPLLGAETSPELLFAFESADRTEGSTVAVRRGDEKLILSEDLAPLRDGRSFLAFDLEASPHEDVEVGAQAGWARELFAAARPGLEALTAFGAEARAADLEAEKLDELEAMGYGGQR